MRELVLNPQISRLVGSSILITGAARSGTTVMGKMVHSLENVEYVFEPPLLYGLLPQIETMVPEHWRLIFETYLFEDFLAEAVAGRRVNLNRNDDSSIYGAKAAEDVEGRLRRSMRKAEVNELALARRIAFKMPDIISYVGRLQQYYPALEVVLMLRQPGTLVHSLLRKGWFGKVPLSEQTHIWPFRRRGGQNLPYWFPENGDRYWLESSPEERCCWYYVWMYEAGASLSGLRVVDYDRLVRSPGRILGALTDRWNLHYGALTAEILRSIEYQPTSVESDLADVDPQLRERAWDVYNRCLAAHIS